MRTKCETDVLQQVGADVAAFFGAHDGPGTDRLVLAAGTAAADFRDGLEEALLVGNADGFTCGDDLSSEVTLPTGRRKASPARHI